MKNALRNVTLSFPEEILDPPQLGKIDLFTRDVSKSVAFILKKQENCLSVGRVITLCKSGELWGDKLSMVSARVVRLTEEGMALQFQGSDFM